MGPSDAKGHAGNSAPVDALVTGPNISRQPTRHLALWTGLGRVWMTGDAADPGITGPPQHQFGLETGLFPGPATGASTGAELPARLSSPEGPMRGCDRYADTSTAPNKADVLSTPIRLGAVRTQASVKAKGRREEEVISSLSSSLCPRCPRSAPAPFLPTEGSCSPVSMRVSPICPRCPRLKLLLRASQGLVW